jgi:RNA polymerase sigma-70 factor, ECF subfamily
MVGRDGSPTRTPDPPRRVPNEQDPLLPAGEESDWIAAAQAGDRQAFGRLVERYWDRLYRWLYHLTRDRHKAEDLVQETFLKVLAALDSFRPGSNFRAWLFRIGHNNFVNLKRAERRTGHPLPEDTAGSPVAAPPETAADREAVRVVAKAIAELPIEFRSALMLRADEGLSFREVAAVLRITEETARWRVFKARQKLMKVLAPELLPPAKAEADPEAGT